MEDFNFSNTASKYESIQDRLKRLTLKSNNNQSSSSNLNSFAVATDRQRLKNAEHISHSFEATNFETIGTLEKENRKPLKTGSIKKSIYVPQKSVNKELCTRNKTQKNEQKEPTPMFTKSSKIDYLSDIFEEIKGEIQNPSNNRHSEVVDAEPAEDFKLKRHIHHNSTFDLGKYNNPLMASNQRFQSPRTIQEQQRVTIPETDQNKVLKKCKSGGVLAKRVVGKIRRNF